MQEITFVSETLFSTCRLTISDDNSISSEVEGGNDHSPVLYEDKRYWYSLHIDEKDAEACLFSDGQVIRQSPSVSNHGIIDTKSQAGLLVLKVCISRGSLEDYVTRVVEILPAKFDLLSFRAMVDDICQHAIGLALRLNSSVSLPLRVADSPDISSVQQRFFFLQYLLNNESFRAALDKVQNSPNARIEQESSRKLLTSSRRLGRSANRAIASGSARLSIPATHPLAFLGSFPRSGIISEAVETIDTPENRFIKFTLESFVDQLSSIQNACIKANTPASLRVASEAEDLGGSLRLRLENSIFKNIGKSSSMPLGSPVLQKKAGYREVLDAWLKFHIAASLHWDGGDEAFGAGKKDTDKLYEYWVFFEILKILSSSLGIPMPTADRLMVEVEGGLLLRLKAGKKFIHEGDILVGGTSLHVRFSYNRTFRGGASVGEEGSWSFTMRPDFTVSFRPAEMEEEVAEKLFQIVHLHFDAKYRLKDASVLFEDDVERVGVAGTDKNENYKRADILVAHSYRDAIRRSGGAYIIYPGGDSQATIKEKYHEVLPGIGAFSLSPRRDSAGNGSENISQLFKRVVQHLSDAQTARQTISNVSQRLYIGSEVAPLSREAPSNIQGRSILVSSLASCFSSTWILKHNVYPVQIWAQNSSVEISLEVLRSCSRLLFSDAVSQTVYLVDFVQKDIKFVESNKLFSELGEVPLGIYAMIPLVLDDAQSILPKTATSLEEFISFTSISLSSVAPPQLLSVYFHN